MLSGKLYFNCLCKKELELKQTTQTVCPDCKRTYWEFTDEKGVGFARLVWQPDGKELEKEFDTKIKVKAKIKVEV